MDPSTRAAATNSNIGYNVIRNVPDSVALLSLDLAQYLNRTSIESFYQRLFNLLEDPACSPESIDTLLGNNHLNELLKKSHCEHVLQIELALRLGNWYIDQAKKTKGSMSNNNVSKRYCEGMDFLAKALQIAKNKGEHSKYESIKASISNVFVSVIEKHLLEDQFFYRCLDRDKSNFKRLKEHFSCLQKLEVFCDCDKAKAVIDILRNQAADFFLKTPVDSIKLEKSYFGPEKIGITDKYFKALEDFRNYYKTAYNDVISFQNELFVKFKKLFTVLIEDAMAILGSPPCIYDIRAMGSVAKKGICPYSDIELMILVKKSDPEVDTFFRSLITILDLQIRLFGETSTPHIAFTCVHEKNPSGLHLDSIVRGEIVSLIKTPAEMAKHQYKIIRDSATIENTILSSTSLFTNGEEEELYIEYKTNLYNPHDGCLKDDLEDNIEMSILEKRTLLIFKSRLEDFNLAWKEIKNTLGTQRLIRNDLPILPENTEINIKKQYTQLIDYLLGDIALFFEIRKTNTFEIIRELMDSQIVDRLTGDIFRKSVEFIYCLRIRLHLEYKEQNESAVTSRIKNCPKELNGLKELTSTEVEILFTIYWVVIRPLYAQIKGIVEKKKKIKEVFNKNSSFNIIKKAFADVSTPLNAIKQIPFFLSSSEHRRDCYQYLSEITTLEDRYRNAFLNFLKTAKIPDTEISVLADIPNKQGDRQSFFRNSNIIHQQLECLCVPTNSLQQTTITIKSCIWKDKRYLKENIIKQILEEDSTIQNDCILVLDDTTSLRFSLNPMNPLMDYAINDLMFRFVGESVALSELILLEKDNRSYPVLISQVIPGENLHDIIENNGTLDWDACAKAQWTSMYLCSILVWPNNGILKNYVIKSTDQGNKIYSINNQCSFLKDEEQDSRTLFVSALFFLFQKSHLDNVALKVFCSLEQNIGSILDAWIDSVFRKKTEYDNLGLANNFTLFQKKSLFNLMYQYLDMIEKIRGLIKQINSNITPLDLLSSIILYKNGKTEFVGSFISQRYETLANFESSITEKTNVISLTREIVNDAYINTLQEAQTEFSDAYIFHNNKLSGYRHSEIQRIIYQAENYYQWNGEFFSAIEHTPILRSLQISFEHSQKKCEKVFLRNIKGLNTENLKPFLHPELKELDICGNEDVTTDTIKLIAKQCSDLEILTIDRCFAIEKIIGTFPKLKELRCSKCLALNEINLEAPILNTVVANHNYLLRTVHIQSKNLNKYESSFSSSLLEICLKAPALQKLVARNNDYLEKVDIDSTTIDDIDFDSCPRIKIEEVKANVLKKIYGFTRGNNNFIAMVYEVFKNERQALYVHDDIESLNENEMRTLSDALEKPVKLTNLRIKKKEISEQGYELFFKALGLNQSLIEVNLSGSKIPSRTGSCLEIGFKMNTTIQKLNIASCGIREEMASIIKEGLKFSSSLTHLNLNKNRNLGNNGFKSIGFLLKENRSIKTLKLADVVMDKDGFINLMSVFEKNPNASLKTLSLKKNKIEPEEENIFEMLFKNLVGLTSLDLSDNQIKDKGLKSLGSCLQTITNLKTLLISGNQLTSKSAKHLSVVLKKNRSLTELDLSRNLLEDKGAKKLIDDLENNVTLMKLNLTENGISLTHEQALKNQLDQNEKKRQERLNPK